ncbi:hypothetical protein H5410_057734 [Solanum commersonii]|uniref:Uncharacterized protein n=1 Tax=Solanum commersonii TaxID=4109 RepID=A0A9J5WRG2_SOLCO|nr:hypothetical protein H5410_057734 [Solanum commersonii]
MEIVTALKHVDLQAENFNSEENTSPNWTMIAHKKLVGNHIGFSIGRMARDDDLSSRQQKSGSNKSKRKTHGRQHSWYGKTLRNLFQGIYPANGQAKSYDSATNFNKIQ